MIHNLSLTLIDVSFLLLSQSNGGRIFQDFLRTRTSTPLLTGWLFVCFILMSSIYGGEIFSTLTVTDPPHVPRTTEDLAEFNLPIFTADRYSFRGDNFMVQFSFLEKRILPQLVSVFEGNSQYLEFLSKIKNKLVFCKPGSFHFQNVNTKPWSFYQLPFINNSVTVNSTFVILSSPEMMALVATANPSSHRLIIRNNQGPSTPFKFITYTQGNKNYFSPNIYKTLGQLVESGIYT